MENTRSSSYYECTFCKRGFTNAQALGGHMNIHRKGKSKLKPESPKSKPNPNFPSLNCTSTAIPPRTFHDHQVQMDKYFSTTHILSPPPPPPPPPSLSCASFGAGGSGLYYSHMCYYSPLPTTLPCNPNCPPAGQLGFHGGDPGFNLNMQIGSSRTHGYEDSEEEIKEVQDGEDVEDDDGVVDLELRLGRPPRRR